MTVLTHAVARYEESPVLEFQGNPLIEALPPILCESDAASLIMNFPPVNEHERELDSASAFTASIAYVRSFSLCRYILNWNQLFLL